ncbi:hypothetical protein QQS21_004057 [Conoideocrella luteorostrata]|uniref:Heterokaryon incompatibility domain-containing protein n=1 Tax=Conoideocrella luteorostrata TaxID=1105319 RepID=A0AAJ0CS94_9HYPO|nr:hypothetical protein QQS21_004057 [Conoideocrella luteorostrata]
MKKLSRMLSRRRPGEADSDPDSRPKRRGATVHTHAYTSASAAATGFHQLPSRRALGSELVLARTHRELRTGVSGGCIVADGSSDVRDFRDDAGSELSDISTSDTGEESRKPPTKTCPRCAAIDFPRLLNWRQGQPRPWVPLSHVLLPSLSMPLSPQVGTDLAKAMAPQGVPQCPFCIFFRAMIGPIPADSTSKFNPYLRIRQAFERLDGIGEKHELAQSVLIEVMTKKKSLPWGYLLRAEESESEGIAEYEAKEGELAKIQGRQVLPMLNPALPKCWLEFCKNNHSNTACTASVQPVPGLQLIDCLDMRVVAADDVEFGSGIEYLTLSYVWAQTGLDSSLGDPFELSALFLNSDRHLPDSVPSLFADAIAFAPALGYRYLWIDRLCLQVQSSERRRQIELMGEIYSRSSLTLIIAAEDSTLDGIPGLSTPREGQLSLRLKNALYTTSLIRPDLEVASSRWASRAWTFQEGLLSRRRLIFTPSQVYFQCRALHCYESISLPLRLASDFNLGRVFPVGDGCPKQSGQFKDLIKAYMCRDLTNSEERLDAFKALLREYERMDGLAVKHFLGLPLFHPDDFVTTGVVSETDRLAASLGWICDWTTSFETPVEPSCYRTTSFPSWTWLAWNLRSGLTMADIMFSFNLVGNASPILNGVSAAPRMEISVGFKDDTVLSWEIDGDAISRKDKTITFLRLETFCFDLSISVDKDLVRVQDVALSRGNRLLIEAIIQGALLEASGESPPGYLKQEYQLVGVLVSGRNWKDASGCATTALICGRRNWEPDGPWVRLGAVAITSESFTPDGENSAVLKGVEKEDDETGDLKVSLRELDLY